MCVITVSYSWWTHKHHIALIKETFVMFPFYSYTVYLVAVGCTLQKLGLGLLLRTITCKLIQEVMFYGWIVLAAPTVLRKVVSGYTPLTLLLQLSLSIYYQNFDAYSLTWMWCQTFQIMLSIFWRNIYYYEYLTTDRTDTIWPKELLHFEFGWL